MQTNDAETLAQAVLTASRALVALSARSVAVAGDDISIPQFRVLVILATAGSRRPVDLADSLGISRSSVTRLCDRLVFKNLISRSRDAEDRREVILTLTPAGIETVRTVLARRLADITEIVARIPPSQRSDLIAAFQRFADAAGELPDQSWATAWDL